MSAEVDQLIEAMGKDLERLERKRKAILAQYNKWGMAFGGGAFVGLVGGLLVTNGAFVPSLIPAAGLGAVGVLILYFVRASALAEFSVRYKRKVIGGLLEQLHPGMRYLPSVGIPERTFNESNLFSNPDRYSGEDCFKGQLGETDVVLSEVHAEKESRDKDGNRSYSTIFRGLFMVADFHKHFSCTARVMPDVAEGLLGSLGRALQSFRPFSNEKLIYMEDVEFEKHFVVYGSDDVETRYLLSTAMLRRILDLRKAWGDARLSFAFRDSSIYVAIPLDEDMFEPDVHKPVDNRRQIGKLVDDIESVFSIVDDLSLNTRIWSKA